MPFRSLRPEERGNALATPLSAAARDFYSEKQSSVYTTAANASIQKDLTVHALELLNVDADKTFSCEDNRLFVLLDLGAGSGLSTTAAQDWFQERKMQSFTLAFDISASMLSLASPGANENQQTPALAEFYCGNAAQKLPLRNKTLDGAIGISMLQWLQPKGLEICFTSLLAQLSDEHDSRAVFQVYPSGLAYVDVMEKTALRVGFDRAEAFVSFPHSTTAKKWFFCVEKLSNKPSACESSADNCSQELCLFARRYHRRCVLQWLEEREGCTAIRDRVEKEHVKTAWHIWRKYRRSLADAVASDKPTAMHKKAQQSLALYPSDTVIGCALQQRFAHETEKITLNFLLQHKGEVVDVLHTAYTEARAIELAAS